MPFDTINPSAPEFDPINFSPEEAASGFVVSGSGEPQASVKLEFSGGSELSALVGANGKWEITVLPEDADGMGSNETVAAKQTDAAGNISVYSETL